MPSGSGRSASHSVVVGRSPELPRTRIPDHRWIPPEVNGVVGTPAESTRGLTGGGVAA